jgi:hypothetical protein
MRKSRRGYGISIKPILVLRLLCQIPWSWELESDAMKMRHSALESTRKIRTVEPCSQHHDGSAPIVTDQPRFKILEGKTKWHQWSSIIIAGLL